MGGHNAGDVASKLVTTSLGNYFEATATPRTRTRSPTRTGPLPPGARRLVAGVSKANRDVHTISSTPSSTTAWARPVVAIHLAEGMVHIAHVGDSRCYRIRDGEMTQMTRDHSLINDALDMKPDLTKEELARLPKNIITRALGMKDVVKVDIKSEPVLPGDLYLLCSDGLTGMVPVDHILEVISLTPEPQEACELLIAEANDHGGTDNISAVLVHVKSPGEARDGSPGARRSGARRRRRLARLGDLTPEASVDCPGPTGAPSAASRPLPRSHPRPLLAPRSSPAAPSRPRPPHPLPAAGARAPAFVADRNPVPVGPAGQPSAPQSPGQGRPRR